MAVSAEPTGLERYDVRTIVGKGAVLGLITVVGVVVFALVSRPMDGTVETVVQSVLIVAGGAVFAYYPAAAVRPVTTDAIAWAATLGLIGALVFTVLDTAILRPVNLYHWTWDEIGGGSGFWYISVWWMGAAVLAWLGSWAYARAARGQGGVNLPMLAGQTVGVAILLFAILVLTGLAPFHSAIAALAVSLALIVQVPLAAMLARR